MTTHQWCPSSHVGGRVEAVWPRLRRLAGQSLPLLLLAACSPSGAPPPPPPSPLTGEQQAAAIARGQAIAAETFSVLASNLQSALATGGVSNALPFCSLAASPLTAGVAARHGVALRRVTDKPRNPAARASAAEAAVLARFRAALTAGQPPAPFATNLAPGQATFFAPIVLSQPLCLNCHGEPEREVTLESLALIHRHYPRDEATGFKTGDLRGAWRIDFPLASLEQPQQPPTPK